MAHDDEENPPVGFERDPESDDIQDGTWIYADGTRKYGSGDPQLAQQLLGKSAGLAGAPPAPTSDATDQAFLASTTGAEQDEQSPPPEPAPEASAPLAQSAAVPPPPVPPPAPTLGAGQSGSRLPVKSLKDTASEKNEQSAQSSESVSRTGSAQDKGEFQQQQADIAKGYGAQEQAQDTGAQGIAGALQQRQQALAQMGADKEAATAGAQASAELRKAQVIKKYQEVDSRKTDMNGLWKDKGALGTTLGLLGVALRSLTATKFGGPNTALQAIQEQKRQNLQAQMEDRNSELRGLERELGSIEAAAPMLEARMNDAMSKRLDAMTVNEKSATVLANAQQMKTQLETEKASKMAESAKAYAGTLAQQQSLQSGQTASQGRETAVDREAAGAGKAGDPLKMALDYQKELQGQNYTPEQIDTILKAKGLALPRPEGQSKESSKEEAEAGKRSEDQGKAAGVQEASANYAATLGLVHDKSGQWVPGGKPGSEGEQKAARTAMRTALHLGGFDEKSAEASTPEAGGTMDKALGYMPLLYHFANATTPEDQAAQLNAAEGVIRPRLNPADRAASTSTERGMVKGKKVGNMSQAAR